jgi:CRP-like cAMP-binding protein
VTIPEFLRDHVPFLKGIRDEDSHALGQAAEHLTFKMGQTVIFKGVTVDGLHVLARGKVGVYVRPDKNKDWFLAAELGPGEVFGERSILELTTAAATIKSAAPETLIFVIPQEAFLRILDADPAFKARTLALIESRSAKPAPKPGGSN